MFAGEFDEGPLKSRLHKKACWPSFCCLPCNFLLNPCRKAVSKKKKRFTKDGFDLDLTYITPRIICHGFPAVGLEHIYRNPRSELKRFYAEKHPGKNVKVFNFCCEPGRGYSASDLGPDVVVERYPFRDHGVPPLQTIVEFTNAAKAWLDADPAHVVSLHCKAGKGRAGIMTCCLLVRTGFKPDAMSAMQYYDGVRVSNNRGLTVTSQRKFVSLYEKLWREIWCPKALLGEAGGDIGMMKTDTVTVAGQTQQAGKLYPLPVAPSRRLTGVLLSELPECLKKRTAFSMKIMLGTTTTRFEFREMWKCGKMKLRPSVDTLSHEFTAATDADLVENFSVQILSQGGLFGGKEKVCELWFNTIFLQPGVDVVEFPISELNIKKKFRGKFEKLKLTLFFDNAQGTSFSSPPVGTSGRSHSDTVLSLRADESQL